MNLKKLQNLPNLPIGKGLNVIRWFKGVAPCPPIFAELALAYRCNLNCRFCYQSKDKRENFPDMNIEDAKAIEENIRNSFNFKPRIHLFDGKPSINKDFIKILKYFSEKKYKISMTTNGVDIDKYIKFLATIIRCCRNKDIFN